MGNEVFVECATLGDGGGAGGGGGEAFFEDPLESGAEVEWTTEVRHGIMVGCAQGRCKAYPARWMRW